MSRREHGSRRGHGSGNPACGGQSRLDWPPTANWNERLALARLRVFEFGLQKSNNPDSSSLQRHGHRGLAAANAAALLTRLGRIRTRAHDVRRVTTLSAEVRAVPMAYWNERPAQARLRAVEYGLQSQMTRTVRPSPPSTSYPPPPLSLFPTPSHEAGLSLALGQRSEEYSRFASTAVGKRDLPGLSHGMVMCASSSGLGRPGPAAGAGWAPGPLLQRLAAPCAAHEPGPQAGGQIRVGGDPARVPVVKSESAATRTRTTRRRESEEECERRSPSQNQNCARPNGPPSLPYPNPLYCRAKKRHHLGQGSRPGGKMGRATPSENKVAAAPGLAPDPRSMATPLLTRTDPGGA